MNWLSKLWNATGIPDLFGISDDRQRKSEPKKPTPKAKATPPTRKPSAKPKAKPTGKAPKVDKRLIVSRDTRATGMAARYPGNKGRIKNGYLSRHTKSQEGARLISEAYAKEGDYGTDWAGNPLTRDEWLDQADMLLYNIIGRGDTTFETYWDFMGMSDYDISQWWVDFREWYG